MTTTMLVLFALYALLNVLDVHSTYLALKRPGVVESNPLINRLLKSAGFGGLALAKLAPVGLAWVGLPAIPMPIAVLANLAMIYVVVNNYRNARK